MPPFRPLGPLTPLVEATGGVASAVVLGAASAVRRKRVFHPVGEAYEATLIVDGTVVTGAELTDVRTTRPCTVRLSRGVGLPESLPDVLGLAIRVDDLQQDLLLVTSNGRHVLLPSSTVEGRRYSSLVPFTVGDRRVLVGARPLGMGQFALEISDATGGPWQHVGTLKLGERLPDDEAEALRFDPSNAGGGLEPAGFVQALRRLAYRGSQAGRPVPGDAPVPGE